MMAVTALSSVAGGVLIGLSATLVLALHGRVAGITGIVAGAFKAQNFALPFLLGLVGAGALLRLVMPSAFEAHGASPLVLGAAGLVVGLGTRRAGGCTSGHGVCGVARGAPRSLVATGTFMLAAMITVYVLRHGALRGLS